MSHHGAEGDADALCVLVVDDHSILTEALRLSLGGSTDRPIEVLIAEDLAREAVLDLAAVTCPDVVLLDLDLGESGPGVGLVEPLTSAGHRVVLFTGATQPSVLGEGLAAGASGVLRKTDPFHRLVDGIADAAHGRAVTSPAEREELIAESKRTHDSAARHHAKLDALTPREREILERLGNGDSAAQIAQDDFVSLATVRSQIKAILRKLGVSSQLAAVALTRR